MAHQLQDVDGPGLLQVSPPWTWIVGSVLAALGVAGGLLATLGQVEVHERAKGVLKPRAGIRQLQAQVSGTVAELLVYPGSSVEPKDICARLMEPALHGALLEAEEHLHLYGTEFQDLERKQQEAHLGHQATLAARVAQLEQDEAGCRRSVERCARKTQAIQKLVEQGILEVLAPRQGPLARVPLRSGMLMDARFTLRRQSPMAMVFRPLHRWLN